MFMIYWCFQRDTMKAMGKHYQTGAPIPDNVLDMYIVTTKKSLIVELQSWVEIASVDLELHSKYTPGGSESIYDVYQRIQSESEFLPPLPQNKALCSTMRQEFGGQYGSVFFDYLLSDVIAADAFSELEGVGLSNAEGIRKLGLKFRNTFLSFGGGIPPNEVFADFRGRGPILDVQRMLKLKGMTS
ncbi:probable cytosolic oligopeptidase A [Dioscorea cayenensis subsp. rotundata]|uniref:Probable cytosolic oligopeptidase A n=2 Tax=Dioscorea cayennensis subsp. rotundata TaxID=55577 RepID=A0AB40BGC1_DIOCR|nr:probable cytosolic oligopeptidase A [Dioscorea cayenensis subsp. rotundata]